ncbi:hypothetical protein PLESTB_000657700 [Pleodorina starrii]|uniref:Uncharacterized protein n=1 Tax=Pleodorina starrii TaxID=330485 RepID=A0A9W6BJ33_9CHLO|nr:hypothetical protein PLESTM_001322700 [Pleodorina starrii]GLC52690.1 hypothetical protein PLESTB_000657700 [Pleodorina starrii]GLC71695.1 hypothetical protein PLESTF_001150500 [Pleodorina starrii]
MDRVMVRVSSAKNSFTNRFSPARSYSVSAVPQTPQNTFSFQTFVYLLFALCGIFLVAHFIFTASESSRALRSSLRSLPAEAILQAQLIEKAREIEKLKWEIDQIRKGVDLKESNMNEHEGVIQQLKTKARIEHEAKTKAELALSDRAGALHECQQQKTALAGEVAQCHFDLQALLGAGGTTSRAVSQQSSAALGDMARRKQEMRSASSGGGGGLGAAGGLNDSGQEELLSDETSSQRAYAF